MDADALVVGLSVLMMGAVAVVSLFRPTGNTHVKGGDHAQTNLNQGERQVTAGAITTIQVYENALAELDEVLDCLHAIGEHTLALREGRHNGDYLGQVESLQDDGAHHARLLFFTLVRARENAYPHHWTKRDRDEQFRKQANGKHVL